METITTASRVVRLPEILKLTQLSRSTIYRLVKNNDFPPPLRLAAAAVGWRAASVEAWLSERQPSITGRASV